MSLFVKSPSRVPRLAGMLVTVVICAAIQPLLAQDPLTRVSAVNVLAVPISAAKSPVKGSDTAYDPVNHVFLTVATCYNAEGCPQGTGQVYGIFSTEGGTVLGAPFAIDGNGDGNFPRARFSADLNGGQGGFMVVWSEEMPGHLNLVRVKTVSYGPNGEPILGERNTINGLGSYSWIESGPAIGYSPVSRRFLIAWRTYPFLSDPYLAAVLVGLDGQAIGGVIRLSSALGRDPGVAWDSNANRFGVSFTAENSGGTYGFASFASVSPEDGSFVRESFSQVVGFEYISDVDYNPDTQRFVMTWHQKPGGQSEVQVAEIAANAGGVVVVSQGLVTRLWPAYDALSIARNPSSRTLSIVSLSGSALSDDDVAAVELNQNGYRTSNLIVLGPDVTGRYPRVSSSTENSRWNVSFSDGFASLREFVFETSTTDGGPPGTYSGSPSPSPSPTPTPTVTPIAGGCTTPQPVSDWVCVNGNWLPPDLASGYTVPSPTPTPTPGACTTPQPGPTWTCSNGNWLPPGVAPPPPPSPTPTPTPTPGICTTPQPDPTWTCVNGAWLPPSLVPPSTGGCTTPQPGSDWVCVSGNWLPPGIAPSPTPTPSPGACTTPQPDPTWSCVNGAWLPPSLLPPSTGSCTTVQPGPGWTCVNGDWKPPAEPAPSALVAAGAIAPAGAAEDAGRQWRGATAWEAASGSGRDTRWS